MADKRADISPTIRIIAFFSIVAVATFGLAIMYRSLPTRDPVPRRAPFINTQDNANIPAPVDPDRAACERGGGLWTECGDPCRGSASGTVCVAVCERQCVCGGTKGWTCGEGQVCGRQTILPGLGMVGVCQKTVLTTTSTPVGIDAPAPTTVAAATATMEKVDSALVSRAICSEDQSFCLLRSRDWEGATFTWPLTLKGTWFLDQRFKSVRWELHSVQGELLAKNDLAFTRSASTPSQATWSLTVPKPTTASRGTKRVILTLLPEDGVADVAYPASTPSFEFYIK